MCFSIAEVTTSTKKQKTKKERKTKFYISIYMNARENILRQHLGFTNSSGRFRFETRLEDNIFENPTFDHDSEINKEKEIKICIIQT